MDGNRSGTPHTARSIMIRYIVATYQPEGVIRYVDYVSELKIDAEVTLKVDVGWLIVHLRNKTCQYQTWNMREGTFAEVYPYKDHQSGEWFISTHPDKLLTNNLDELIK